MQIEPAQHLLGACEHALVLVLALLRRGDRNELDFGELMLADHAAGVLAGSTGFRAEAGRAGGEAERQRGFVDDRLADEIGERDFSRGDEPELFYRFCLFDQFIDDGLWRMFALLNLLIQWLQNLVETILTPFHISGDELVISKLWQLSGPKHHVIANQERRCDLGIPMFARVQIEHELPKRALRAREAFLE